MNGKATLLAAATANLRDLEPKTSPNVTTYKGQALIVVRSGKKAKTSPNVTTYKGQALIIVRSGKKAGKATITATSTQFKGIGRQNITIK